MRTKERTDKIERFMETSPTHLVGPKRMAEEKGLIKIPSLHRKTGDSYPLTPFTVLSSKTYS